MLPALAFVFLFGRPAAAFAGELRKPNIVIILADDLGYGELGCYGHPQFKTPHLDKLAGQGARLTQFNTPMPFCAPTRAALLTGRYPSRCGMPNNPAPDGGAKADAVALPGSEITLAQVLKQAGYATGMVGKWHLGHAKADHLPTRRGFDEYLGILYSNDMRPVRLMKGENVAEYPLVQATLTDRYTQWALDFLERNKGRSFFLYFAHTMPHKPLACSEAFYKKSSAGLYGDVIAELDASVGRVLAKLKELGLDDNTLVIFTSDNGPWYGGSTGGLRGMKGTTWEGGYRVPCIALAGPSAERPNDRRPGHHAGPVPDRPRRRRSGSSARPHFRWPQLVTDPVRPRPAAARRHYQPQWSKDRQHARPRWKLHLIAAKERKDAKAGAKWIDPRAPDGVTILAPYEQYQPSAYPGLRSGDETRPLSLFDLVNDPGEQRDVAAQHPDIVERLQEHQRRFVKDLASK